MLSSALPGLAKRPVTNVGGCLARAGPTVTTAFLARTPRMSSSELVTPFLVVSENRVSAALPIRWLVSDIMV